eukprot:TRINITY_DN8641_c0_g1_i2.p1 TRINITY_DN8641_c0_g1~~TRINITY_DN8641_c0_g1_i2.p1  ORF type:complete len:190 (+),score=32.27 TRINITY_DN8641_c0_g1_i2:123-692(+)
MSSYYVVPANTSECIHIPRTMGGSLDPNAIDPGMINHRLSREEINYLIERFNKTSKGLFCKVFGIFFGWFSVFFFALAAYIHLSNKMRNEAGLFIGYIIFVFSWVFMFIFSIIKLSENNKKKLQEALNEENELRLHSRGLHIIVGPYNRYLTLHLNYSPAPVINTFPQQQYVIAQPTDRMNQPFLVPSS